MGTGRDGTVQWPEARNTSQTRRIGITPQYRCGHQQGAASKSGLCACAMTTSALVSARLRGGRRCAMCAWDVAASEEGLEDRLVRPSVRTPPVCVSSPSRWSSALSPSLQARAATKGTAPTAFGGRTQDLKCVRPFRRSEQQPNTFKHAKQTYSVAISASKPNCGSLADP
jgi:hypothetical protein